MTSEQTHLTPEQDREIDRLLATANLFRMRGQLTEAEGKCREVLAIAPGDLVTREMLSDILWDSGKTDEALEEIREARKMAPDNASVEKKFAKYTLLVAEREREKAIALDMLDNPHKYAIHDSKPGSALLLAIIPGMGQFYNGEMMKAYVIWGTQILFYLTWAIPNAYPKVHSLAEFIASSNPLVLVTAILATLSYIYGMVDAPLYAAKLAKEKENKSERPVLEP